MEAQESLELLIVRNTLVVGLLVVVCLVKNISYCSKQFSKIYFKRSSNMTNYITRWMRIIEMSLSEARPECLSFHLFSLNLFTLAILFSLHWADGLFFPGCWMNSCIELDHAPISSSICFQVQSTFWENSPPATFTVLLLCSLFSSTPPHPTPTPGNYTLLSPSLQHKFHKWWGRSKLQMKLVYSPFLTLNFNL